MVIGRPCIAVFALALICASMVGCASYTDHIRDTQRAISDGDPDRAIDLINERLKVEELDEAPSDLDGQNVLFLLERATLLQAITNYRGASRDMIVIDDRFEWIDIQSELADNILNYVYSADTGNYRPPPHERLMLNSMNMINFMAQGDHSGARVEARRFDILQQFFLDEGSRELVPDILGLGNYLAGAAFEASRQYNEAARYYTLAYLYGTWPENNPNRLLDLIQMTGYTGSGLGPMRTRAIDLFERVEERTRLDHRSYRKTYQSGDTLIVVQTGLVPYRKAERIPLNRALQYTHRSPYASVHLNSNQRDQALALYSTGMVTWLNTATLTREGLPPKRSVSLDVGGSRVRLRNPIDIASQVERAWEAISATALAAGISRALVRAAAGEATRLATTTAAQQHEATAPFAGIIGWLSKLALQGSLAATDTPDTRSWTSLPADIHLVRTQLQPGPQSLGAQVGSRNDHRQITVNADSFELYNFSRYR